MNTNFDITINVDLEEEDMQLDEDALLERKVKPLQMLLAFKIVQARAAILKRRKELIG